MLDPTSINQAWIYQKLFFSGAYVYSRLPKELRSEANFNNFINLLNKYEYV